MENRKDGRRARKQRFLEILESNDLDAALDKLSEIPCKKVVNVLFSFLHSTDENIKWPAVTLMGAVVAKIADEDMESARVIMRRLMWNLNDESGGIGWGSPEAMGEILACHDRLAEEYFNILLSYTSEVGNYLENEMLQRGLLWGIGRLARVRPRLIKNSIQSIILYLKSKDVSVRGLATWIVGMVGEEATVATLEGLREDEAEVKIYINGKLHSFRIKDLANDALDRTGGVIKP